MGRRKDPLESFVFSLIWLTLGLSVLVYSAHRKEWVEQYLIKTQGISLDKEINERRRYVGEEQFMEMLSDIARNWKIAVEEMRAIRGKTRREAGDLEYEIKFRAAFSGGLAFIQELEHRGVTIHAAKIKGLADTEKEKAILSLSLTISPPVEWLEKYNRAEEEVAGIDDPFVEPISFELNRAGRYTLEYINLDPSQGIYAVINGQKYVMGDRLPGFQYDESEKEIMLTIQNIDKNGVLGRADSGKYYMLHREHQSRHESGQQKQ